MLSRYIGHIQRVPRFLIVIFLTTTRKFCADYVMIVSFPFRFFVFIRLSTKILPTQFQALGQVNHFSEPIR